MWHRRASHWHVSVALAATALVTAPGCGGSPSSPSPEPPPGATVVRGTERLAWDQDGAPSALQFRAYVDDRPVDLAGVQCSSSPPATCRAPLPALTDGLHTIAVTNIVMPSGIESFRTNAITVQKVSTRAAVTAASFPDATARRGSLHLESVVTAIDGFAVAVDIVARGIRPAAQLAALPDGRLLVAQGNGLVQTIRPGEPGRGEPALDAGALLSPPPIGPLGIASHPNFQQNHYVYVSFLARDRSDRAILRLVRLREVNDTLGEPATLFEAALRPNGTVTSDTGIPAHAGPRLAFGPDGLLYIALPVGIEFDHTPGASRPHESILRLSDNGSVPRIGPLTGVTAQPLGFTWHPETGVLWLALAEGTGGVVLRPAAEGRAGVVGSEDVRLRMEKGAGRASGAWIFRGASVGTLDLARSVVGRPLSGLAETGVANDRRAVLPGSVRLMVPILAQDLLGIQDRVGDVAIGGGGTLFVATENAGHAGGADPGVDDVVLRFSP